MEKISHKRPAAGQVIIVDKHVQVTLPALAKYDYRTTPSSWEELVQIIEVEQDIYKLSRSRQQQHDYEVFRHHMKEQYRSTIDFILISKLGVEAIEDTGDGDTNISMQPKWKAKHSLADMQTPIMKLIPNDFPYFNEDGIEHYIYWKTLKPITDQEIDQQKEVLRERFGASDILFWINPPELRSIPEIDHVHFLLRKK